jgi:hypothetical protein
MVANPDGEDEMETGHIFFHPIAEGVQDGVPLEQVMYIAPSFVNGAEFPRWINRNWESLASDLSKKAQYNAYMIQLPERGGKEKDFDFITWFIFDEFEELHRRTLEANEDPDTRITGQKLRFNKMYSRSHQDGSMFTLINKNVLDQMFKVRTCTHTHTQAG